MERNEMATAAAPALECVPIASEGDIVAARKIVREVAVNLGFGVLDVTRIVTASSELTRNIFRYAGSGRMRWRSLAAGGRSGLELVFEDQGPGILNLEDAMTAGFSTSGGLGLGLPGAKRLMDDMEIDTRPGNGTRITIRKWLRS
jgi:serine/threonine-protein kinase RsbT